MGKSHELPSVDVTKRPPMRNREARDLPPLWPIQLMTEVN
ncbi:hypothetical protein AKJ09_02396 [Labilithrix luteola]|uniref:Uncharacterized protein n=1 Tax=Labilithrix luteola TaxID=1391654 RepID=A0A0K1PQD8_9BACT|nr:hypothetical protein AKJ09_02396 [Labilithrix luteola]